MAAPVITSPDHFSHFAANVTITVTGTNGPIGGPTMTRGGNPVEPFPGTIDDGGNWSVSLPPNHANGIYVLTVSNAGGEDSVTFEVP